MRALIHRFASLRVTVALIVLVLLALSAGTIVESMHGTPAAGRLVYGAVWFHALLAVFALNLLCSIIDLWPWGRRRIGYALTHGSMLVILAGAVTTDLVKTEGQLQIWEGEETHAVLGLADGRGEPRVVAELPFSIRLDAFEIDHYEGTGMPSQYRSRVTVREGGRETPAVIEMNRELHYGDWRFFQSSYRETEERDLTVLTASRDPGEPIVFLGYYGLVLGMLVVLGTRIAERRRATMPLAAVLTLVALAGGSSEAAAQTLPPVPAAEDVEALRRLPVQHDGRVMPLDTLAREGVFKVTGKSAIWGLDPVATALGWSLDPAAWAMQPIVPVGDARLAAAIGLPAGTAWASFQTFASSSRLMELVQSAHLAEEREQPLTGLQKSARKLEARLLWLQRFLHGDPLRVVPAPEPGGPWSPLEHLHGVADLRAALEASRPDPAQAERLEQEILYNRARPSRLAWIVLLAALVLSVVAWNLPARGWNLAASAALVAGFAVMSWGLWLRWQVGGRIPASNMYESLLFLAWGVGAFAVVAMAVLPNRMVILNAAAMSALTMALTDLLPIDPFIHPMPPVLAGTYWLAIHVPIIMVGYSVFALGVVAAHIQLGFQAFAPARRGVVTLMADLLYWYTQVGAILLIAGILTGSMWAASSWGRYWGWDPKEVWSLVAFLAYMAILHARAERLIGPFGVAAWSIVAFQTILMTYLGVNFVLSSGLHSYGFGESNVVNAMVAVAVAEAVFIGFAWSRHRAAAQPLPAA